MQQLSPQEEWVKLQKKGLLTLPKRFRDELKLKENEIIRIKKEGQRLVLEPVQTLSYPVRSYTPEEIKEFLALDARETRELKRKKLIK